MLSACVAGASGVLPWFRRTARLGRPYLRRCGFCAGRTNFVPTSGREWRTARNPCGKWFFSGWLSKQLRRIRFAHPVRRDFRAGVAYGLKNPCGKWFSMVGCRSSCAAFASLIPRGATSGREWRTARNPCGKWFFSGWLSKQLRRIRFAHPVRRDFRAGVAYGLKNPCGKWFSMVGCRSSCAAFASLIPRGATSGREWRTARKIPVGIDPKKRATVHASMTSLSFPAPAFRLFSGRASTSC